MPGEASVVLDAEETHALCELGAALLDEGRLDQAHAIWKGLAALSPSDDTPAIALAMIAYRQGRIEGAIDHASSALAKRRSHAALSLRAEALVSIGRYTEAAPDLEEIVRTAPHGIARRAAALLKRCGRPGVMQSIRSATPR
jgi:tetratricopeptide (TPR) repeat protein